MSPAIPSVGLIDDIGVPLEWRFVPRAGLMLTPSVPALRSASKDSAAK